MHAFRDTPTGTTEFFPIHFHTLEIYAKAVVTGMPLRHVPVFHHVSGVDMADRPMLRLHFWTDAWRTAPETVRVMCDRAVDKDPWAVTAIPLDIFDLTHPSDIKWVHTIWSRALAKNGRLLKKLPMSLRTKALCAVALECTPEAWASVPSTLRPDGDLSQWCIIHGTRPPRLPQEARHLRLAAFLCAALQYGPNEFPTELIPSTPRKAPRTTRVDCARIQAAWGQKIATDMKLLRSREKPVPPRYSIAARKRQREKDNASPLSPDEWGRHLFNDNHKLYFSPYELCTRVIHIHAASLAYIPAVLRTQPVCAYLLDFRSTDEHHLSYVPLHYRTDALCLQAVRTNGRALLHVPESCLTLDLCVTALLNTVTAFLYIPAAWRAHAVEAWYTHIKKTEG